MKGLFRSIWAYFSEILKSIRSAIGSVQTVIPYLFGIGELRKEITEQYPDPVSSRTEEDLPPRTRGLLMNDITRCTGCEDCQKICPVDCIEIELEPQSPQSAQGKKWVSVFDIDFGKCIFCGLCVEVCHPGSLTHTKEFEGAVYELGDLVSSFGRGRVSAEQRAKWSRDQRVRAGEVQKNG